MDTFRWVLCLILAVPAALCILGNWGIAAANTVESRRAANRQAHHSSFIPWLGGLLGAVACLICPDADVRSFAWLPLVLDLSIVVTVVFLIPMLVLHLVARVFGLTSPFDAQPSPPS